jgi:EAL domain-containing protein (putative c-di-GMP-specific phosphodiesterase class I)
MVTGVETTEQLEFLRSLECDERQGFLFCGPHTPADAESALAVDDGALFKG